MNKGFKTMMIVMLYLIIYYFSNIITVLTAGLIFFLKQSSNIPEEGITTEILVDNVQLFYFSNLNIFIVITALVALSIYWVGFKIKRRSFSKYINFSKISLKYVGICSLLGVAISLSLTSFLTLTSVHELFPDHSEVVDTIIGKQHYLISLVTVGIVVPIFEEILYRGLIFNKLRNNLNIHFSIFVQALIFGVVHGNQLQMIYTFFGGIILVSSYIWMKSIWAPILIHIFWNITGVTVSWVNITGQLSYVGLLIISIATIVFTINYLSKNRKPDDDDELKYSIDDI